MNKNQKDLETALQNAQAAVRSGYSDLLNTPIFEIRRTPIADAVQMLETRHSDAMQLLADMMRNLRTLDFTNPPDYWDEMMDEWIKREHRLRI